MKILRTASPGSNFTGSYKKMSVLKNFRKTGSVDRRHDTARL